MHFANFNNLHTDQITPKRLKRAHSTVEKITEIDAHTVSSPIELAERLQGFSRAVTDIVLSQGIVELTDLSQSQIYDPETMPRILADYSLTRFDDPTSQHGRMFEVVPGIAEPIGALLTIQEVTAHGDTHALCEARIPTDRVIDRILTHGTNTVEMEAAYLLDFRGSRPSFVYPFHPPSEPSAYLGGVQELSGRLLSAIK